MTTILDQLESNALHAPTQTAFERWSSHATISNAELLTQAKETATHLLNHYKPGEPVFFIFPAGLDCIIGYYACLFAGIIPIPYPTPPHHIKRVTHYWDELSATAKALNCNNVFCADSSLEILSTHSPETDFQIHSLNAIKKRTHTPSLTPIKANDAAHIQLTSGSTGTPKGVTLTHHHLYTNPLLLIEYTRAADQAHVFDQVTVVNWLPHYHDLGLVIGVLIGPILCEKTIILDPAEWATDPIRWFEAISYYDNVLSGAPNFALQRCIDRIQTKELANIDLSSWHILFTGAEAAQENVLTSFATRFSPYGLSQNIFKPGYGLAESTSCIATFQENQTASDCFQGFDQTAMQKNQVEAMPTSDFRLASNGSLIPGTEACIVDPGTHAILDETAVGEIWLSGNCIAKGYWNNTEATQETFFAKTAEGEGPYLRTGDKGFIWNNEIFVVSRLKDIIIINGKNYSPAKIEEAALTCLPPLITQAAAFSQSDHTSYREKVVLLIECKRHHPVPALNELFNQISASVLAQAGCKLNELCILSTRQIPLTGSGKIRRSTAKERYQKNRLNTLTTIDNLGKITHHVSLETLKKHIQLDSKDHR